MVVSTIFVILSGYHYTLSWQKKQLSQMISTRPHMVWSFYFLCFGGIANLVPSMIGTLFGRWDYPAANRVIYPIVSQIFGCCFKVVAAGLNIWGTYTAVYIIFLILTVIGLVFVLKIDDRMIGTVLEMEETME